MHTIFAKLHQIKLTITADTLTVVSPITVQRYMCIFVCTIGEGLVGDPSPPGLDWVMME